MGATDMSRRKRDFDGNPVQGGGGGGGEMVSVSGSTDSEHSLLIKTPTTLVAWKHFETAFRKLKPSVSKKDRVMYEEIKTKAMNLK